MLTSKTPKMNRVLWGSVIFLTLIVFWLALTSSAVVDKTFLPSISEVGRTLARVFVEDQYLSDVWISIYRVVGAFILSAVLAVPIGLLAGHVPFISRLVEPFVGFVRYLPVPAFVPLCIL